MAARGWKVTAIEKNEKARNFAHETFGLNMLESDALSTLPDESFDVITMWHVLEHIEDINKMANEWTRLLKPRGTVIIALPNADSADAKMYGEQWAGYDVPRHLWHFNHNTVQLFAQKHDFRLIAELPMPFDAFYVAMLSEKYKNNKA